MPSLPLLLPDRLLQSRLELCAALRVYFYHSLWVFYVPAKQAYGGASE